MRTTIQWISAAVIAGSVSAAHADFMFSPAAAGGATVLDNVTGAEVSQGFAGTSLLLPPNTVDISLSDSYRNINGSASIYVDPDEVTVSATVQPSNLGGAINGWSNATALLFDTRVSEDTLIRVEYFNQPEFWYGGIAISGGGETFQLDHTSFLGYDTGTFLLREGVSYDIIATVVYELIITGTNEVPNNGYDNLTLSMTIVPAPASGVLLGGVGVYAARRRRRG